MDAIVATLIAWIVAKTGLAAPDPPRIALVPASQLVRMLYGQQIRPNGQDVRALYSRNEETIYLIESWNGDNVIARSELLHELVHHVQNFNRVEMPCLNALEPQAYALHFEWLREQGVENPHAALKVNDLMIMLISRCPWVDE